MKIISFLTLFNSILEKNLPQICLSSSEWSSHLLCGHVFPSQSQSFFPMHWPSLHVIWSGLQLPEKKISQKSKELYYIASKICKQDFQQPFIVPQINSAVRGAHYLETRENVFRLKLDKTTFYIITMHHHPVLFWSTWFWPKTLSRPVRTSVYDVTSLIYFLFWSFFQS